MSATTVVGWNDFLRDVRHMRARAASDLADWLVHLELQGKATRSIYAYHRTLAALLRAHPDHELAAFTPDDIERHHTSVPKKSRAQVRSIINQFFKWATFKDRIERNPMDKVATIRQPETPKRDIFKLPEIAALEALPAPDGQLFAIMFGTGIRKSECRNLRREHVDLDRGRLIVRQGKGGRDRIVALMPSASKAVADLDILEALQPDQYLWHTYPGGGNRRMRRWPMGDTTFSRWYANQIEAAGVRYLSPHTTRHTYHELLRMAGLSLEERQAMMGHRSIRTTADIYGHLDFDSVADKLAGFALENF
jgi:integrase